VLCNAVYFKGQWADRFNSNATHALPFFTAPGQKIDTPLMTQTLKLRSRQFDDFVLFALPYTSNLLSMVVLLPKALDGLGAIEQGLDATQLQQWLAALDAAPASKTVLYLPKFRLTRRLDLADNLTAMGMPTAFGPQADFSGMSARRDLFIDKVVHQAFVDVNEEGTEAAAATAVMMRSMAVMASPTPVLRVDHPFMFLIRENRTGSILFLGRVTDPSK
jgi:serpin B